MYFFMPNNVNNISKQGDRIMKKEYSVVPKSMKRRETYGFAWMGFIAAMPSPIFVATTYKANEKPNVCLQS